MRLYPSVRQSPIWLPFPIASIVIPLSLLVILILAALSSVHLAQIPFRPDCTIFRPNLNKHSRLDEGDGGSVKPDETTSGGNVCHSGCGLFEVDICLIEDRFE
jgi:hypothetical protein